MNEERKKLLLDATAGIREEYIEEAATAKPVKTPWLRVAAIAAVLALVIGWVAWPRDAEEPSSNQMPFFAIRAYAQDGALAKLETVGDSSALISGKSHLFPGKQTFTLEIYLTNEDRSRVDLTDYEFLCFHRGRYLKPGDCDGSLSVTFLDENGVYGYRLTGWCDDSTLMDISVEDKDGLILYQRSMRIDYHEHYTTEIYTAYNYDESIPTEELIDNILAQDYSWMEIYSSAAVIPYSDYANRYGGFQLLERREDAASLLLERWLEEMEEKKDKLEKYVSLDQTGLLGKMLAQDVYWNQFSQAQLKQIEQFGLRRWYEDPLSHSIFPGKRIFSYSLMLDGKELFKDYLTVEYNGKVVEGKDEHLCIAIGVSGAFVDDPKHGWAIMGWFEEPTVLTLTVTHKDGFVIRQEVILVTPTEDGYQIEVIKQ